MVITFDNVSFKYTENMLLNEASFSLTDSSKVGLIGVNGTGKSTTLKLICGLEKPLKGTINISGGMIINYLEQDPKFTNGKTLFESIMEHNTKEHPINDYEAKSILNKLKLFDHNRLVDKLSGGERKRLALCIVLVTYSDMLILDEPTNHLDNDMIIWLEKYLIKFKHGLLMVTHDRYFLEKICNSMLELDFGKVYQYPGNYDYFLEEKAKRIDALNHSMQKLKSILKTETEWMRRGVEARRTKSKSRIERFNKLNEIEFNTHGEMKFDTMNRYLGKKLITIKHGSKAFDDKVLFKDFNLDLQRSDAIGIVGANGAGKTTLFKIIMGLESLDEGELIKGETLHIGYFSQTLELIDPEIRVIDYISNVANQIETLDGTISASELLENFLFDSSLQYSKVKMLSGGEKKRLQLVKVLMGNPNLLILDEPTNDLDIYTLELLEDFLDSFMGPILVVSHDRYFLDKVCNKLFVFQNQEIKPYLCSFSEYLDLNIEEEKTKDKKEDTRVTNRMSSKDRNELNSLELDIPKMESEIKVLKESLIGESTNYHKLMEINESIEKISLELDKKTERYLELMELKESFNH